MIFSSGIASLYLSTRFFMCSLYVLSGGQEKIIIITITTIFIKLTWSRRSRSWTAWWWRWSCPSSPMRSRPWGAVAQSPPVNHHHHLLNLHHLHLQSHQSKCWLFLTKSERGGGGIEFDERGFRLAGDSFMFCYFDSTPQFCPQYIVKDMSRGDDHGRRDGSKLERKF